MYKDVLQRAAMRLRPEKRCCVLYFRGETHNIKVDLSKNYKFACPQIRESKTKGGCIGSL